jgi:Protein of unknown function (DUF3616)
MLRRVALAALGLGVAITVVLCVARAPVPVQYFDYHGMCEASAAVAVDANHFLVADDQDSTLRLYARGKPEPISPPRDLAEALGVPKQFTGKDRKTDIEGAAAIGKRIYWITGHSERWRTQRLLFATDFVSEGGAWDLKLVGTPYRDLREDLLGDKVTIGYIDNPELRDSDAENGFNIEGLAATPDGKLLIGLRNPVVKGKALVVRLDNPDDVLLKGAPPKFGKIIPLPLDGHGIRSIERVGDRYLIISGSVRDEPGHSLYWWSGSREERPTVARHRIGLPEDDFRPEALFAIPDTNKVQLLGDDGNVGTREAECRKAAQGDKKLRSIIITP